MDIMIAGAGTVGYSLAKILSHHHNIIILDQDREKLERISEELDVLTMYGDVKDPKSYRALHLERIDLFIAVTNLDDSNLLSTLIAEEAVRIGRKIVRLKNDAFKESRILEKLSIDHAVFPDLITARKISALLAFPKANNVKTFHQTTHKMVSIRVEYSEDEVYTLQKLERDNLRIVGMEREKLFWVPQSDEVLQNGDLIYLFGECGVIQEALMTLADKMPSRIKRVVIFGANPLARKVAMLLLSEERLEIKMIEKDLGYCKEASRLLQDKVTILNSSYEDQRLFEEEGLREADMIIAAGENDEKNILKCIEAKEYGVKKVVAVNNDQAYYRLMHKLGVAVVRGSIAGAHYAILEKISSSSIITQRLYCGGEGVLFMRKVYAHSPLIAQAPKVKKGLETRCLVVREMQVYPIAEITQWIEEDLLVVFGKVEKKEAIESWIYAL